MNIKSELTTLMYADNRINTILHERCRNWIQLVLRRIYEDINIKQFIFAYISGLSKDAFETFVDNTLAETDLNAESATRKKRAIMERYNYASENNRVESLFTDVFIYDLFFILYLKGGMAIRYICLIINTLSGKTIYTPEMMLENFGNVSDYDFNIAINPILDKPVYNEIYKILSRNIIESFDQIKRDDFFVNPNIIGVYKELINTLYEKFPILRDSTCGTTRGVRNFAHSTLIELDQFKLARLMVQFSIKCRAPICIKESEERGISQKSEIPALGELIDISFPSFENIGEKKHAWKYANNGIYIFACNLVYNRCLIPDDIQRAKIDGSVYRIYTLNDIIDDIVITIGDSIKLGNLAKIEKRRQRLAFLNTLFCRFTLITTQKISGLDVSTLSETNLAKKCHESFESKLCVDEYVDERVAMYISNIGLDLPSDNTLIYNLIIRFIRQLSMSNIYGEITAQLNTINNVLELFEMYIQSVDPAILEGNSKYFCNLLINAISVNFSLNDNYIKSFIVYLFLQNILSVMAGAPTDKSTFVLDVIAESESISSTQTRPFIKNNAPDIITALAAACDRQPGQTDICIRGGVACHMNLCGTLDCVNSNDIDINVFTDNVNFINDFITSLYTLLNDRGVTGNVSFSTLLIPTMEDDGSTLFQLLAEYDNPNVYSLTYGPTTMAPNVLPKVKHHLIEIRVYNSTPDKKDWVHFNQLTNTNIYYLNSQSLCKQFNIILNEGLHWYRKSKYLRRIAALNGIMADRHLYNLYESEFTM
jgi:hypothetical protein